MTIEVEMKFPLVRADELLAALDRRGVVLGEAETQVDAYYAHPQRDFAETDEALRVRSVGQRNWLTYKGPRLDPSTKTRSEIEVAIEAGQRGAADMGALLAALGFGVVGEVRKRRRLGNISQDGQVVEVTLDEVENLGTFVELELRVGPGQGEVVAARTALTALAEELGLGRGERRSYLELLLAAQAADSGPTGV